MSNEPAPLAPSGQADAPQQKKLRRKANAPKKRSQPKTMSRPASPLPSSADAQPVSMPAALSAEALAKGENHDEQRDAELKAAAERDAARQEAERQEAMRREEERKAAQQQALARHRQAVAAIDGREREALREFDTRRRTLAGRAAEFIKGKQLFDTQRRAIMDRFEAERMTLRREF
jgi:colicin import membrane protein